MWFPSHQRVKLFVANCVVHIKLITIKTKKICVSKGETKQCIIVGKETWSIIIDATKPFRLISVDMASTSTSRHFERTHTRARGTFFSLFSSPKVAYRPLSNAFNANRTKKAFSFMLMLWSVRVPLCSNDVWIDSNAWANAYASLAYIRLWNLLSLSPSVSLSIQSISFYKYLICIGWLKLNRHCRGKRLNAESD